MAKGSADYWLTQSNFLPALVTTIKDALIENSALINKLDAIDSKLDGQITLTQLNSVQCDLLAKLTGIDTSLLTGSDLLNKLDILDGTMDGKLDLTQLNASSVKTNLDTVITNLVSTVNNLASLMTKMDTSISNLNTVVSTLATHTNKFDTLIAKGVETYNVTVYTGCSVLAGAWPARTTIKITNTVAHTLCVYLTGDCSGEYIALTVNQFLISHFVGTISAKCLGGTTTAKVEQW